MKFEAERLEIKVLGAYSSFHPDKGYKGDDYFVTEPRDQLVFSSEGIQGDRHFGYETTSGGRFTTLYEKGTRVRNNRQWSAISPQEIDKIAKNLEVEGRLTPELLGINLLLEGVDKLSELPPMAYLVFSPHNNFQPRRAEDVTLVVYGQALPCIPAGRALVEPLGDATLKSRFPKAALGIRGTTGWVEHGGIIRPGYTGWILNPTGMD